MVIPFSKALTHARLFKLSLFCVGLGGLIMFHVWQAMGKQPDGERLARIQQSPRFRDGKFRNQLANRQNLASALKESITGKQQRTPDHPLSVLARSRHDYALPPQDGLRLTWFGHSSILMEIDGFRVLTDPVWGPRTSPSPYFGPKRFHEMPLALDQLPKLDAVVISHDHYDHLDYPSIRQLAGSSVHFFVPLGVGSHLAYWGIEESRIHEFDWWQEAHVGDLRLVLTPARHFSGRGFSQDKTLWGGWAVIGPRHKVYFSGDSGMFPCFKEIGDRLGPFDVTFMESGAYNSAWPDVHMGPEQAVQAHRMVRGDLMIPVHWGTFSLAPHAWTEPVERVLEAAARTRVDVYIPRQGELLVPGQLPDQVRWWPEIPWKSAAESPVMSTSLPEPLKLELLETSGN